MLGNEEHQLNSPITPLSFDFKKRRSKARSNSPDILKRSSPDLVQRPKKSLHSQEDVRGSDFSSSDYAPVSTEGWIITDNRQRKYSQSTFAVNLKCYLVPEPPPPPKRRPTNGRSASPCQRVVSKHSADPQRGEHSPNCFRRGPNRRRNSMHLVEDDLVV